MGSLILLKGEGSHLILKWGDDTFPKKHFYFKKSHLSEKNKLAFPRKSHKWGIFPTHSGVACPKNYKNIKKLLNFAKKTCFFTNV